MIGAYQPNVTTMSHGRSECRAERTVIQCKLNLSATGRRAAAPQLISLTIIRLQEPLRDLRMIVHISFIFPTEHRYTFCFSGRFFSPTSQI